MHLITKMWENGMSWRSRSYTKLPFCEDKHDFVLNSLPIYSMRLRTPRQQPTTMVIFINNCPNIDLLLFTIVYDYAI